MSESVKDSDQGDDGETRRDFLTLATVALGAAGAAAAVWPLVDSMNPAADTLALSSIEVDLKPIETGQRITVKWRGKPVFITAHRPKSNAPAPMMVPNCAIPKSTRPGSKRPNGWFWLVFAPIWVACHWARKQASRAANLMVGSVPVTGPITTHRVVFAKGLRQRI